MCNKTVVYSMRKMGKTFAYIASVLGISRQRAHQLFRQAELKYGALNLLRYDERIKSECHRMRKQGAIYKDIAKALGIKKYRAFRMCIDLPNRKHD